MPQCRQFSKCEEVEPVIVCRLCGDSWDTPVELQPCGHIFCKVCLLDYKSRCPSTSSSCDCTNSNSNDGKSASGNDNDDMRGVLCPTCRCMLLGSDSPNRLLVNKSLAVNVRCSRCGWQGSREQSGRHVCEAKIMEENSSLRAGENSSLGAEGKSSLRVGENISLEVGGPSSELLRNFGEVESPPASCTERDQVVPAIQPSGSGNWEDYGLTQEEYDQIMSVFVHFDTEGRGFLTRAQLRQLAFSLNYVNREEDIDHMLSEMGCDESGGIMFADLRKWLGSHHPNPDALYGLSQYQYTQVVLQYRSHMNQSGLLSWEAFRELCLNNNYAENHYEAWELFRSCDRSLGGVINLHEFLLICQRLWGINENNGKTKSNMEPKKKQQRPQLQQPPPPPPPQPMQVQPYQQYTNPYGNGEPAMYETPLSSEVECEGKIKRECSVM
ncbi:EF hand [Trypanosoma theileri]|uniref:EF hand n=1 Tax=Trypanosoma theileri TaxID=67003 RepID=A0A1X0NKY5_9TRYP|nr:EF hand [Trypanosoma theileri]ORC85432.1 EF hand [Trypanosoma theileri]